MKRFFCWLWGHKFHPDAAMYYNLFDCERCGFCCEGCPTRWEEASYRIRGWWDDQCRYWAWKRWREWWKCSDCGWRCGRHDPNTDHVPF